jgi:hypothetical protein
MNHLILQVLFSLLMVVFPVADLTEGLETFDNHNFSLVLAILCVPRESFSSSICSQKSYALVLLSAYQVPVGAFT